MKLALEYFSNSDASQRQSASRSAVRVHEKSGNAILLSEALITYGRAALFVLMGTLEASLHPKVLANVGKHFAFTRCGESNLFGMADAQLAVVESELLVGNKLVT